MWKFKSIHTIFFIIILMTFTFFIVEWNAMNNLRLEDFKDVIFRISRSDTSKEDNDQEAQHTQRVVSRHKKDVPLKDWHDILDMLSDAKRVGPGEQGDPAYLKTEGDESNALSTEYGFNALLSDIISLRRALPDLRHKACRRKLYPAVLPTVSIVMPFYNELPSALLRSLYSVTHRSPPELLKEIILVDDASTIAHLGEPLEKYINQRFRNVKILRLTERSGLIGARLFGARKAKGDVLIFLDSHIEANYNWLPPLLEPIALNKRTVVCPFIDVIDDATFEYTAQDEGARGAFNWVFDYKRLPLLPEDEIDPINPFKNPIMAGGLFAISAEFFWELGGYDEGLDIWGGEQYELSFKIWNCGGSLLDAPCSRVGHIYRNMKFGLANPRDFNYLHKNYKRVAEVWMDEYKNYLYARNPDTFAKIDAGDLSKQKALREKLKCKPFKWFIENVAFDLVKRYPPVEPPDIAHGAVQSVANPGLCIDALNDYSHSRIGLFQCAENLTHPQHNQNWAFTGFHEIRLRPEHVCWQVNSSEETAEEEGEDERLNNPVWLYECNDGESNQFWEYDRENKWLVFNEKGKKCLEANLTDQSVFINPCRTENVNMKWNWGFLNKT